MHYGMYKILIGVLVEGPLHLSLSKTALFKWFLVQCLICGLVIGPNKSCLYINHVESAIVEQ